MWIEPLVFFSAELESVLRQSIDLGSITLPIDLLLHRITTRRLHGK